jgi:hypothetical protein
VSAATIRSEKVDDCCRFGSWWVFLSVSATAPPPLLFVRWSFDFGIFNLLYNSSLFFGLAREATISSPQLFSFLDTRERTQIIKGAERYHLQRTPENPRTFT